MLNYVSGNEPLQSGSLAKAFGYDSARLHGVSDRLVFFVTGRCELAFVFVTQTTLRNGRHSSITRFYWRKEAAVLD
jgi:hypothetical protein